MPHRYTKKNEKCSVFKIHTHILSHNFFTKWFHSIDFSCIFSLRLFTIFTPKLQHMGTFAELRYILKCFLTLSCQRTTPHPLFSPQFLFLFEKSFRPLQGWISDLWKQDWVQPLGSTPASPLFWAGTQVLVLVKCKMSDDLGKHR